MCLRQSETQDKNRKRRNNTIQYDTEVGGGEAKKDK